MTYRETLLEAAAERYADALIEIVAQPWRKGEYGDICPCCHCYINPGVHQNDCPWLIAARALGVQP